MNKRLHKLANPAGLVLAAAAIGFASAQTAGDPAPPAGTGSAATLIEGKSALRAGDQTSPGATVTEGSPNVFIDGRPAAIAGSRCGNGVTAGSASVFINGKPAAVSCGK